MNNPTSKTIKRTKDGKIDLKQFQDWEIREIKRTMSNVDKIILKVERRLREEENAGKTI